jgi:2-methylaconitate cis-trans-isomerase PrpF
MIKLKCVIMRGGTSRAVFFHENELPSDPELRDKVVLDVFGSPDIREIDGLGGADALTSKLSIISRYKGPEADVEYNFGQVMFDEPLVSYGMNCGNISAAGTLRRRRGAGRAGGAHHRRAGAQHEHAEGVDHPHAGERWQGRRVR